MQLAEPIHEAAGEGLLSGADLQLEAMQPVAGRGWGVIPLMQGEGQQGDAEFTVRASCTVTTKSTNSPIGLRHNNRDGELPDIA
jgi:hypothetical protein